MKLYELDDYKLPTPDYKNKQTSANLDIKSKDIDEKYFQKVYGYLEKYCSDALKAYEKSSYNIIYRGQPDRGMFVYKDASQIERKSRNTTNEYTTLIDILPSWKDWPKRSRSTICTGSYSKAGQYSYKGIVYAVFPFNGCKIGVCSSSDFWESFPIIQQETGINNLDHFNTTFRFFLDRTNYDDNELYTNSIDLISKRINDTSQKNINDFFKTFSSFNNIKIIDKNIIKTLDYWFNPKNNGFNLIDTTNLSNLQQIKKSSDTAFGAKEIFFAGPCIMIDYFHLPNIIKRSR